MMKSRCGCRGNVVVVVMEVSGKDVSGSSLEAASWALNTLLQSGDCLVLLGVHPADASNPCARSNLLGYRLKSELKSDPQISIERSNYIKQEELVKRKSEIEKRIAPIRVSCSQKGVRLEVEVKLGPPRIVAVQEATSLQATWVVLDRRLKKDKKFFLDQLTCGLIRMRRNNEGDILCAPHRKIEQQDNSDIEDGVIINPDNFVAYPGYESEFFSFENSQSNIKTPISSSLYQNILFTQDNMQHRFGHRDQKMEYLEGNTRKIFSNTNDNKELFENTGENLELKSGILSGNIILRKSLSGSNFDDLSETLSIISRPSISRTSSCENLAISCSPLDSRVVRFYEVAYKRAASVPVEMMMSPESVAKIVNKSSVFQAPVANNPPPVSVQPRRMHNNELLNSLLGKELFDYSSEPNYFEINDDMTKKESEYKSRISERIPIEGIGSTSINGNREIAEIVNGYDFDHCHQQQSDLLKMNNKKYQMNQLDHVWSKFVPSLLCSICKQVSPSFRHAPKMFTFAELEEATGNFSPKNFIAEGGFGFVYKGILREGQAIAVKQHKIASLQGEMEFRTEVELLSCAQHRNLIMLLGFCNENGQRILVYEYVCNKSLDWHLSLTNPDALEWWARRKIAVGAARGLRYLHEECRVGCIVHRDMRPNNILLTHEFEPMVGDFGLARSQPSAEISIQTRVIGSFGYLAPEYVESGKVSWKSDVYAFGVVLLELITGYKAFDLSLPPREQILPEWTQTRLNDNRLHEIVDQRLQGSYDEFELHCMVQAAKVCISKDPSTRPKISQVLHILEGKTTDVLDSFNLLSTCYRDRDNAAAPITTNQPQKYNSFPINNINIINNNNHNSVVNSQEKKARALSSKSRKIKLSYDEML